MNAQFVDVAVSNAKFDQEVDRFTQLSEEFGQRGWFLVRAAFPEIFVIMAAPALQPAAIVCGVVFDYSNYDAVPPSVRLVNPFTRTPYTWGELPGPLRLNRKVPSPAIDIPGVPGQLQVQASQPLMQAFGPDEIPFLCIAGVREYHEHPGHSGDAWELHRTSGAGGLVRLLEVIHTYGVAPIKGYGVNLVPQVGFDMGEPPA